MIKTLPAASWIILASPLLAGSAAAGPSWTHIGKGQLPRYGSAELYFGNAAAQRSGDIRSGELHAVLDEPWVNPDASGSYRDIYFRVRANCRDRTIAVQPTWPDSPSSPSVRDRDMQRPGVGSGNEKLLKAYCG